MLALTFNTILAVVYTWLVQNPWAIALALYVAINLAKRIPPPTAAIPLFFWQLFERVMFLGWDKWGGALKWLGTVAPAPTDPASANTPATSTPKIGPVTTLAVAAALAFGAMLPACAATEKIVTTVTSVLSDALFAIDQMDAAFGAFCAYSPEMCAKVRGQYEQKRGAALHAIRFGQNAVGAYNELFSMLEDIGVVTKPGVLKSSPTGFQPWAIQSPFEGE
jgi:hypothetical protein